MIANQSAPSAPVVPVLVYDDVAKMMPFGVRNYTARDPGGHWWTFSQNIADVAPHEWGAIVATPRT